MLYECKPPWPTPCPRTCKLSVSNLILTNPEFCVKSLCLALETETVTVTSTETTTVTVTITERDTVTVANDETHRVTGTCTGADVVVATKEETDTVTVTNPETDTVTASTEPDAVPMPRNVGGTSNGSDTLEGVWTNIIGMATSMEGVPWHVYVAIALTIFVASVVAVLFINNVMVHKQRMTKIGFDKEVAVAGIKARKVIALEGMGGDIATEEGSSEVGGLEPRSLISVISACCSHFTSKVVLRSHRSSFSLPKNSVMHT